MKVYFAVSIRGGDGSADSYPHIINHIKKYANVLTEHFGNEELKKTDSILHTDKQIFSRDVEWIRESDIVIAEVSTPSLGVGYELAFAERLGKPALCLYRSDSKNKLSAMISGNNYYDVREYKNIDEARSHIDDFIKSIKK